MFSKVIVLLASVAAVLSAPQHLEAARYPAGVSPQACPNFPICDNAALHGQAPSAPSQYSAPQYNHYSPPAEQYQHYEPQPSYYNAPALSGPTNNHLPGAGGDKYPAGVDPKSCPNFPICDNAALHGQAPSAPASYSAPQYNHYSPPAEQYQHYEPQPSYYNAPAVTNAGGDKYPAGVNPQSCPNYPYCDTAGVAGAPKVAPLQGFTERQYPAGVSAHECPNFPYCN